MVNDIICFDTESAQGRVRGKYIEELIEISIMNLAHEEIFYHRFKPTALTRWNTSIHHITPSMVAHEPSVENMKNEMQHIFNSAKYIVGFSLIDDFKAISKAWIANNDKKIIELRHLYWYCMARHNNAPFYSGPGLTHCAESLGINVVEEAIHSATGDTRVTLDLFFELMKLFNNQEGNGDQFPSPESSAFINLVDKALVQIDAAKYEYDKTNAAGYIHIAQHEDGGYRFIPTTADKPDIDGAVLSIKVNARRRAAFELERNYARKRIQNSRNFNLSATDIKSISHYSNKFDNQEQMYQRLLGLQRNMTISGIK